MSLDASDREPKRSADLLIALLRSDGWLRGDDDLDALVPEDARIVPYHKAGNMWDPTTPEDPAPVVIAADAMEGAGQRNNAREEKRFIAEVEVAATDEWVETNGSLALTQIFDTAKDALARHREDWTYDGISADTGGIAPDGERNRFVGVFRADFLRDDPAPAHD